MSSIREQLDKQLRRFEELEQKIADYLFVRIATRFQTSDEVGARGKDASENWESFAVDDEGYLVATSDFHEPVGPSYWEREQHERNINA